MSLKLLILIIASFVPKNETIHNLKIDIEQHKGVEIVHKRHYAEHVADEVFHMAVQTHEYKGLMPGDTIRIECPKFISMYILVKCDEDCTGYNCTRHHYQGYHIDKK